jgi:hypothetical protein
MISDWSTAVTREYMGFDARFDLPVRPLGPLRLLGVLLLGVGLGIAWSPAREVWALLPSSLDPVSRGEWPPFRVFEIPFLLLVGGAPLILGLLVLFGSCRVEWWEGRIRTTERLGPLPFTRRLPRTPPRVLRVVAAPSPEGGRPSATAEVLSALVADYESGPRRLVALGYPRPWLLALANELRTLARAHPLAPASVEVMEGGRWAIDSTVDDAAPLPDGSRIGFDEWRGGLRMRIPAAGLWRGSSGLFLFAVAWCAFLAFFTAFAIAGRLGRDDGRVVMAVLFVGLFWAAGLGMLAAAVHMGRRTAVIEVEDGRLRVATRGLLGARERAWSAGELRAIRVDASGWEVSDRPVPELQIHPRTSGKVGLLGGRDEGELRWIAARLRRTLGVPARPAGR